MRGQARGEKIYKKTLSENILVSFNMGRVYESKYPRRNYGEYLSK